MALPSNTVLSEFESDILQSARDSLSMDAFFLVSRAEHARMWRRITHLRRFFRSSLVAAFERTGLPINHSHEYVCLGRLTHGKFFARFPVFIKAIGKCIKPVKASSVCYAFSLDLLFVLFLVKLGTRSSAKLVYEVADIHPSLSSNNVRGRVLRFIERALIRRCCAVVITSPAFRSGYFADKQRSIDFPCVVIEHKVSLPASIRDEISFRFVRESILVIGYIGLMKSPASFSILSQLAEIGKGRIMVHFHGRFVSPIVSEDCFKIIESSPYLEYIGPYRSPEDLERVYKNVDLVWDAYREGDNARWQRTTRFSEACFFKRPVICNPETQDGQMATQYGLGMAMSFDEPEDCIQRILSIDESQLRKWYENFNSLPRNLVFYDREYDDLVKLIEAP